MRASFVTAQHGWIVAWAVSLVLLAGQGHGTASLIGTLLLVLLLSLLLFVVPRTVAAFAAAVGEIIGFATSTQVFSHSTYVPNRRVHLSDVPVRFLGLQLPPPLFRLSQ